MLCSQWWYVDMTLVQHFHPCASAWRNSQHLDREMSRWSILVLYHTRQQLILSHSINSHDHHVSCPSFALSAVLESLCGWPVLFHTTADSLLAGISTEEESCRTDPWKCDSSVPRCMIQALLQRFPSSKLWYEKTIRFASIDLNIINVTSRTFTQQKGFDPPFVWFALHILLYWQAVLGWNHPFIKWRLV